MSTFFDVIIIMIICLIFAHCILLGDRYIKKVESNAVDKLTIDAHNSLRYGQFSVLRLIKAADSSQSSCLNWQCLELFRSMLYQKLQPGQKKQTVLLVSRSTVQRSQNALEAASNELAPVRVDTGEFKFNTLLSLHYYI